MSKILTFDQLFESKEKKVSWMPSIEEFNNIEPYKGLLSSFDGPITNSYNRYQSKASITKGVRFIRLGTPYDCKVSPVMGEGNEGRVNFTYGAYKIYSDIPFSTVDEKEKAMELFILYSMSKTSGYNMNQGIFGDIEKFLNGKTKELKIKDSHSDEFCDGLISSAESINDPNQSSLKSFIRGAYLADKYLGGRGSIAILNTIDIINRKGNRESRNGEIAQALIKYTDIDSVCKYMKENPLNLYLLNDMPKIKEEVLQKTGIKDYSKLGNTLRAGLV